jgi:hypothetical protein
MLFFTQVQRLYIQMWRRMIYNDLIHNWGWQQGLQAPHMPQWTFASSQDQFFLGSKWLPKLDLDIIMRPMKLYKMSLEATLIPLVVESNKGGQKQNCELVPILGFETLTNNVAMLTKV